MLLPAEIDAGDPARQATQVQFSNPADYRRGTQHGAIQPPLLLLWMERSYRPSLRKIKGSGIRSLV
jgi:hypothetical protein